MRTIHNTKHIGRILLICLLAVVSFLSASCGNDESCALDLIYDEVLDKTYVIIGNQLVETLPGKVEDYDTNLERNTYLVLCERSHELYQYESEKMKCIAENVIDAWLSSEGTAAVYRTADGELMLRTVDKQRNRMIETGFESDCSVILSPNGKCVLFDKGNGVFQLYHNGKITDMDEIAEGISVSDDGKTVYGYSRRGVLCCCQADGEMLSSQRILTSSDRVEDYDFSISDLVYINRSHTELLLIRAHYLYTAQKDRMDAVECQTRTSVFPMVDFINRGYTYYCSLDTFDHCMLRGAEGKTFQLLLDGKRGTGVNPLKGGILECFMSESELLLYSDRDYEYDLYLQNIRKDEPFDQDSSKKIAKKIIDFCQCGNSLYALDSDGNLFWAELPTSGMKKVGKNMIRLRNDADWKFYGSSGGKNGCVVALQRGKAGKEEIVPYLYRNGKKYKIVLTDDFEEHNEGGLVQYRNCIYRLDYDDGSFSIYSYEKGKSKLILDTTGGEPSGLEYILAEQGGRLIAAEKSVPETAEYTFSDMRERGSGGLRFLVCSWFRIAGKTAHRLGRSGE